MGSVTKKKRDYLSCLRHRYVIIISIIILIVVPAIYFPVCLLAYQHNCGAVTSLSDDIMLMTSQQKYINDPKYSITHFKEDQPFLAEFKNPCYLLSYEEGFLGSKPTTGVSGLSATIQVRKGEDIENDTLRCLPYYYVLGWMKCGTTELFQKMMAHPDILRPPMKEPAWLDVYRLSKNQNVGDYVSLFDGLQSRKLVANYRYYGDRISKIFGDHSTHTIDDWGEQGIPDGAKYDSSYRNVKANIAAYNSSSAQLLRLFNPGAKFIVMIRDPVRRVYSYYKYIISISAEDLHNGTLNGILWWNTCREEKFSLYECLYERPNLKTFDAKAVPSTWTEYAINATRQSLYHFHLKQWLDIFPREQFLIFKFEEFIKGPNKVVINDVFPFLGLKKLSSFGNLHIKMRSSISARFGKETSAQIAWYLNKETMLNKTRTALNNFFRPHNQKLSDLLQDPKFNYGHG